MGEKDIEMKHEKSFAEQIDEVKDGTYNIHNALKVCDTPQILLDAGCEQLPMLYTQRHLIDAMRDDPNNRRTHGLDESLIKSIPDLISAPALIFDSMTRDDAIIVCTDKTDKKNNPVIISVRPNGIGTYELEEVNANFITSIYGKKNFSSFIERIINENKMLYWSKEKSQELFSSLRLQLPQCLTSLGYNTILHQSTAIVKQNIAEKDNNTRRVDMRENGAITIPIQAARALKAELESGKGAMCPETFMRNHITSQNDDALRTFDYCANVVSGAISATAISAINGGKYDGWTEDDFAREYIKSMQELCNAASQYYGPVQFDNFKQHLDDVAKQFGIAQEQETQEKTETKADEHEKTGGPIRMAIWDTNRGMREYTFHELCDGIADYEDMVDKWQNGSHGSEQSPKLGLTFYLKDANDNDGPLLYEIGDKRLEFGKRITVFDAEYGYNTNMEEEIPDYAAYPIKSSWKECVFDIKKELHLRHIDENKKYGWPLGNLNPDKDMFNIFAKRLKTEHQKDSNKSVPIVNLGKRVYHALSPDERGYVNNFLDSSNIHSDKAMEKLLLKAIGEPIKAKKHQRDDNRER